MKTNKIKVTAFSVLIICSLINSFTYAKGVGGDGSGGGNLYAGDLNSGPEPTFLRKELLLKTKKNLAKFVKLHSYLSVENNETAALIKNLEGSGLSKEIEEATFELKEHCYEDVKQPNGQIIKIEKDASTLRGVRGAVICLSKPRHAYLWTQMDTNLFSQEWEIRIAALILHENIRHFNIDDTVKATDLGEGVVNNYHPSSVYLIKNAKLYKVASSYDSFWSTNNLILGTKTYFLKNGKRTYSMVLKQANSKGEARMPLDFDLTSSGPECNKDTRFSKLSSEDRLEFEYFEKTCANTTLTLSINNNILFENLFSIFNVDENGELKMQNFNIFIERAAPEHY